MLNDGNSSQEYAKAIDYIYELINAGTLEVGSRLPTERNIAEQLGIGRNSTREALSILHGMGIIERKQGSGNYISGDAGKSIGQIISVATYLSVWQCEFRRILEKTVCGMIIRNGMSREHGKRLSGYLDELENLQCVLKNDKSASDDHDKKDILEKIAIADDNFHNELIKAADNSLMTVIMDAVTTVYKEAIERVIYNSDERVRDKLIECHRGIYEGIISLDKGMTEAAIDIHYDVVGDSGKGL